MKNTTKEKSVKFDSMVSDLIVKPSTAVVTATAENGKKIVSSQVSKPVAKEIALLDSNSIIAQDTIPSLVSNWDTFQKKAVEDALKLSHRIGRVMYHVGYDKLDETVDAFKEAVKTHFAKKIAEYVEKVGDKKKWSQTPEYKNGIRPIKDGREWVFPTIKTPLQIAEDATKKATAEKAKLSAHVTALSEGDEGQNAISGMRLMGRRMIESAHSVDGRIVMTDAKLALIEKDVFQLFSNFLTDEKLQANRITEKTETGLMSQAK